MMASGAGVCGATAQTHFHADDKQDDPSLFVASFVCLLCVQVAMGADSATGRSHGVAAGALALLHVICPPAVVCLRSAPLCGGSVWCRQRARLFFHL